MSDTVQTDRSQSVFSNVTLARDDVVRPSFGAPRADSIENGGEEHALSQPVSGGFDKEREPLGPAETAPLVEVGVEQEVDPEVESWLEKLEREGDIKLPDPITDENGTVVMTNAVSPVIDEVIRLPVNEVEIEQGLAAKVSDSTRWLAEWAKRLMKMFGNQVQYR